MKNEILKSIVKTKSFLIVAITLLLLLMSCDDVSKQNLGFEYKLVQRECVIEKVIQHNCLKCYKNYKIITNYRNVYEIKADDWFRLQVNDSVEIVRKVGKYINLKNDTITYDMGTKVNLMIYVK